MVLARVYASRLAAALIAISLVSAIAGFVGGRSYHLITVASIACLIMVGPWFLRSFRLISPWVPATVSVIVGALFHSVAIVYEWPDPQTINRVFLLGHDAEWLLARSWIYLVGLAAMTSAFMIVLTWSPPNLERRYQATRPFVLTSRIRRRGGKIASLLLGVGFASLVLLIVFTGGFSGDSLSAKRTLLPGLSFDPEEFETFGYLRFLSFTSVVAVAMLLYCWSDRLSRLRYVVALGAAILLSIMYPFYTSSRSDIVGVVLALLAVSWGSTIRIPRPILVGFATVFVVALSLTTLLRHSTSGLDEVSGPATALVDGILEPLAATQNYADLAKTVQIGEAVPQQLAFQNGQTYAKWIVAPIPRALWPGKPVISTGPLIGTSIYGNARSGVPPGLLGEAHLNFGGLGIPVMGMLFGFILGGLHRWMLPRYRDPQFLIPYSIGAFRVGEFALGQSAGEALVNSALGFALAYPIMRIWIGNRRALPSATPPEPRAALTTAEYA